jgi:hypothetical protein
MVSSLPLDNEECVTANKCHRFDCTDVDATDVFNGVVRVEIGSMERNSNVMRRDVDEGLSFMRPSTPMAVGVDKLNSKASCGNVVSKLELTRCRADLRGDDLWILRGNQIHMTNVNE